MDGPYSAGDDLSTDIPLQFGIRDLLIVQAVCAACCGLFVMAGIFALMAIFIATLVACCVHVRPERAKLKRFCIDLLGGVILPSLCLTYDPFVFRNDEGWQVIGFITIVVQMLALVAWTTVGWWFARVSAVFSGVLSVGAMVSGLIGVCLVPFSVFGLIAFGIGMLGFTPFLTCMVFYRNARQAMRQAAAASGIRVSVLLFLLGAVLAVAIPMCIFWLAGPWIAHLIKLAPRPREWFGHNPLGLE